MKKHLTKDLRVIIEQLLNNGMNFTEISDAIRYDRTTISKEIRKHFYKKCPSKFNNCTNLCMNRHLCGSFDCSNKKDCYEEFICEFLKKPPYVCNACDNKARCRNIKRYYDGVKAHNSYLKTLSSSREGFHINKQTINLINKTIVPLIKEKKQSINHIFINNPKILSFSLPSFYFYIDNGLFDLQNMDLLRKVSYKKRKKKKNNKIILSNHRINKTYDDYLKYIKKNPNASVVQMDTVEGKKGKNEKVLLTLLFLKSNVMLIFLLDSNTNSAVNKVFDNIKRAIGIDNFKILFEVILTDNGSEFINSSIIETDFEKNKIINIFYCDPYASWQKGALEKNHEFIRYYLRKGISFNFLKQEDCNLMCNHINSTSRKELKNKTPIDMFEYKYLLEKLNINLISPNEVNLSKNLFKK